MALILVIIIIILDFKLLDFLKKLNHKYALMVLYVGKEYPKPVELDKQFKLMVGRFGKKILRDE